MLCLQSFTYCSSYPAVPLRLGGWAYRGSWEEGETVGLPQVFCPAASPLSAWVAEDMEMLVGSLLTLPPPVPPHTVPSLTSSSGLGNEDLFTRGTSTLENPKKAMCCVSRKSVTYIILCVTLWKCRSRYWNGKTIVKRNWSIREITPNLILLGFNEFPRPAGTRVSTLGFPLRALLRIPSSVPAGCEPSPCLLWQRGRHVSYQFPPWCCVTNMRKYWSSYMFISFHSYDSKLPSNSRSLFIKACCFSPTIQVSMLPYFHAKLTVFTPRIYPK